MGGTAEVWRAARSKQSTELGLNVPLSVRQAVKDYRDAAAAMGYRVINEDNEGFEAELYLDRSEDLAVMRIRSSACDDATVFYMSIVDRA